MGAACSRPRREDAITDDGDAFWQRWSQASGYRSRQSSESTAPPWWRWSERQSDDERAAPLLDDEARRRAERDPLAKWCFCACTAAALGWLAWGQTCVGSVLHVTVVIDGRTIDNWTPFVFGAWSTVRDFWRVPAPLFATLLCAGSAAGPYLAPAAVAALHAAGPRRSAVGERRRRALLAAVFHLVACERAEDLADYVFSVGLRMDARVGSDALRFAIRAFPEIGIGISEAGQLATFCLAAYAMLHRRSGGQVEKPSPPGPRVVAAAVLNCFLLPVALALPFIRMRSEELVADFIPTTSRVYSVLDLCVGVLDDGPPDRVGGSRRAGATQSAAVSAVFAGWFAFFFAICPMLDVLALAALAVLRRKGERRERLAAACVVLRGLASLEVLVAVAVALHKELGAITSWIIATAMPAQVCDELRCYRVVARLLPIGTSVLFASVLGHFALYYAVLHRTPPPAAPDDDTRDP